MAGLAIWDWESVRVEMLLAVDQLWELHSPGWSGKGDEGVRVMEGWYGVGVWE